MAETITVRVKDCTGNWRSVEVDSRVWKRWNSWWPGKKSKWLEDRGEGRMSLLDLHDMQEVKRDQR